MYDIHYITLLRTSSHFPIIAQELVIDKCESISSSADEGYRVIIAEPPHEPLYITHSDAEVSIPRAVFYMPYKTKVLSTFLKLAGTLTLIIVLFLGKSYCIMMP